MAFLAVFLIVVPLTVVCKQAEPTKPAQPAASPALEAVIQNLRNLNLQVKVGTTIMWTNKDSAPHTVTARDGTFKSAVLYEGKTFAFTFKDAGTYAYFCEIHGDSMSGTVTVSR